jgi:hypothetical protein
MERKSREINGSLVITLPKQVCNLYNLRKNDTISIEPIGVGEIRLRKIPNNKTYIGTINL